MGRKKTTKEKKLIITFDEEARRNYLTGFSKRKKIRKKQAKAEELKKELAKRKEKRAEKRSTLKQTMMRYNLLNTESPISYDNKQLPIGTNGDVTIQDHSGTTVTISSIPALEARIHNSVPSVEESTISQITSTSFENSMSSSSKSSQKLGKLRNKSEKKLSKLKKWNCI